MFSMAYPAPGGSSRNVGILFPKDGEQSSGNIGKIFLTSGTGGGAAVTGTVARRTRRKGRRCKQHETTGEVGQRLPPYQALFVSGGQGLLHIFLHSPRGGCRLLINVSDDAARGTGGTRSAREPQ